jgi:hypothetical protein
MFQFRLERGDDGTKHCKKNKVETASSSWLNWKEAWQGAAA